MTKRISALAAASLLVFTSQVFAISDEEAQALCQQYAQEEAVQPEEMEAYLAQCVQEFTAESSEAQN